MSRLAQKCPLAPEIAAMTGRQFLSLKAYFDCNPPSKLHWSFSLFRAKLKPGTKEALPNPADYAEMKGRLLRHSSVLAIGSGEDLFTCLQ